MRGIFASCPTCKKWALEVQRHRFLFWKTVSARCPVCHWETRRVKSDEELHKELAKL